MELLQIIQMAKSGTYLFFFFLEEHVSHDATYYTLAQDVQNCMYFVILSHNKTKKSYLQATATSIIRVSLTASSTTVATAVKPTYSAGKAVLKPSSTTSTTIIKPTTTGSTIIKPPSVLGTGLKPSSITGPTIIKATSAPKPLISTATGTISQRTISGTSVPSTSVVKVGIVVRVSVRRLCYVKYLNTK